MRSNLMAFLIPFFLALTTNTAFAQSTKESDSMTSQPMEYKGRPAIPPAALLAKLPPDGGPEWNRLVFEKSPYLQQHAANPVDWYPWGEEAFETARRQDKPVFLSVGYSTCHWCHVMEHESFEDAEVARLMNEAFICVKVDREERPDIDHVYMSVTQAMTGSGGWPMTVIMTPDKKPFFAGTYFPKGGRYGRPGMMDLVPHIASLWKDDRARLLDASEYISRELDKITGNIPGDEPTAALLDEAFEQYHDRFDSARGGFGDRPKFPLPHNLSFLLRYWKRTGNQDALRMAELTLEQMRLGGIYDHVGFGFHRYSTDGEWLVPHFEKMLYDQALLAIAYTEAWQITGKALYRQTAEEILAYVLRDMTAPEGGFYSAEDADSEGVEGKFYVWTLDELNAALGEEEGKLFAKAYNFEAGGNFQEESTARPTGENIPHLRRPADGVAKQLNMDSSEFTRRIEASRAKLFAVREKRIHPFKDDKVLTDWNGLMIAALAKGARAFNDSRYEQAARRAADFCLTTMRRPDGRLLKRWRHGEAGLPAHLEDYAFLAYGLAELYEASLDPKYLKAAMELTDLMIAHFEDSDGGAFFQTADDGEELIVRGKDIYDGAIPSGNAVAACTLLRLARLTGRTQYEEKARRVLSAFAGNIKRGPSQFAQSLMALDFALGPTQELILAGTTTDPAFQEMLAEVRRPFLPNLVVLHRPDDDQSPVFDLVEPLRNNKAIDGKATAYVCRSFACDAPTTSTEELRRKLPIRFAAE